LFQSLLRRSRNGDRSAEATPESNSPIVERPTIGLALGGGAARGFAHIGVLRTLLARNIVPDVIVGTSIGAVVGGCYASGQLDTLEDWARQLTKRGILGYLDVSFSGAGLIGGNRLANRLDEAIGETLIDKLPVRFAAITTEVGTGHEIWLTRGRMVEALRASYALPGIFPPVRLGGRWLVDGALVNPVPVSAARALGARLVIAVNLNADMLGRGSTIASHGSDDTDEKLRQQTNKPRNGLRGMFGAERAVKRQFIDAGRPGIPTVMVEAFNIMQDRITRARLAGDPPDVLISPRLGQVGWFDFHRAQQAIEIGAAAAERALEPIAEAINALSTYPAGTNPVRK
jgi:NTE family protein